MLSACDRSSCELELDYIAIKMSEEGGWSFLSPEGEIILENEFENKPSAVVNGLFSVKEGDYHTLYSLDDQNLPPQPLYEGLFDVGYLGEGNLIPVVRPRERISVIDCSGNIMFTLEPYLGKEIDYAGTSYHDGLLRVRNEDKKYGYVNKLGEYVVKPQYDRANDFNEGFAVVCKKRDDNERWFVINCNGERILTLEKGSEPKDKVKLGRLVVRNANDEYYFLEVTTGRQQKCPIKVKGISDYNSKYYIYYTNDYRAGLNEIKDNKQILRPRFTRIRFGTNDCFFTIIKEEIFSRAGDCAIYDHNGTKIKDIGQYYGLRNENSYGILVYDDLRQKCFIIDNAGERKIIEDFVSYSSSPYIVGRSGRSCRYDEVYSDYFDMQSVVGALVDMINIEGLKHYRIGEAISNHIEGNANRYLDLSNITLDDLAVDGFKYRISVTAYYSDNIAVRVSNECTFDSSSNSCNWNPDAYLLRFSVLIDTSITYSRWSIEGINAIVAAFRSKGFTEIASTHKGSDTIKYILRKGDLYAFINGETDSNDSRIDFVKANPDEVEAMVEEINLVNSGK